MREILFRGKRLDNGKWTKGFVVASLKNTYPDGFEMITTEGINYDELDGYNPDFESYDVDPKTVGQCTGLLDMTGKKIYEGDIIKSDNGRRSSISVIKFGQYYPKMFYDLIEEYTGMKPSLPCVGFYAKSIDNGEEMILIQNSFTKVLGNIHDNPEMLGGGG